MRVSKKGVFTMAINQDILLYANELIDNMEELSEAEKQTIIEYAKVNDYDTLKLYVIELKTKYGYYGGKGGTF